MGLIPLTTVENNRAALDIESIEIIIANDSDREIIR
jgi:hypothetical protein